MIDLKSIQKIIMNKFSYTNIHQIPKIEKIVINTNLGLDCQNKQIFKQTVEEIRTISGQHPITTKAKKSISDFKLKENMPVGLKVTLRRKKMYAFFEKLVKLVLPRIRDFRGSDLNGFDQYGNFNLGIEDKSIFPELELNGNDKKRGYNITIVTTASTKDEAAFLLRTMGFIFKQDTL